MMASIIIIFSDVWGLNVEGNFTNLIRIPLQSVIIMRFLLFVTGRQSCLNGVLTSLRKMRWNLTREIQDFFDISDYSTTSKGQRLIQLALKDLLSPVNAMIFENKLKLDQVHQRPKRFSVKFLAFFFAAAIDIAALIYIWVYSSGATQETQYAWFASVSIWILSDIFVTQNIKVIFLHVIFPSLIMKELVPIKFKLAEIVREYRESLMQVWHPLYYKSAIKFNSAEHCCISYKLAKKYPNLVESKIISRFSSQVPHFSYEFRINVIRRNWSISVVLLFCQYIFLRSIDFILSIPIPIQDMIVTSGCVVLTAYLLWIHWIFYQIQPLLTPLPYVGVIIIVHFYVKTGKKENLRVSMKNKVLPAVFDVDEIIKECEAVRPDIEAIIDEVRVKNVYNLEDDFEVDVDDLPYEDSNEEDEDEEEAKE